MLVTEFLRQVNGAYRGTDDNAPTTSSPTDYQLWIDTANRKISEWAKDTKNVWLSNFSYNKPVEFGTVTTNGTTTLAGTSTYFTDYKVGDTITVTGETVRTIASIVSDTVLTVTVAFSTTQSNVKFYHASIIAAGVRTYVLHRGLINPSDTALVTNITIPQVIPDIEYTIGKPQERKRYQNEVYIAGRNPQYLTFSDSIVTGNQIIGGTLKVPGYYTPATLTGDTDIIPVDDPYWLVYATASELAFNDLTYSDKAPDLNEKANNLYSQMAALNRRGTNNNPRVARTNVDRILGVETEASEWRSN